MEKKVYSVSDITLTIKSLLEESLPTIWVEGEISNFKAHYSGHLYFTLKDENAQLSGVMWRSRAERNFFTLKDGMSLRCLGNIRVYEKTGRYQLDVLQMEEAGIGTLQEQFEKLKIKLYEEGLFAPEAKQSIPQYPETVAIVTSPTGAAIEDILSVLKRRAPYLNILLFPVKVQGKGAAKEIVAALNEIDTLHNVDVIIVGRGGGSLEDLWAFNEEAVARAIYSSSIPVISAVGHEIDFTIADFVADMRAPTPSAAAELVVIDKTELEGILYGVKERMFYSLQNKIETFRNKVDYLKNSYGLKRYEDVLYQNYQKLDDLSSKLYSAVKNRNNEYLNKVAYLQKSLFNLNPENVLARGFSITYKQGKPLKKVSQLKKGQEIVTRFMDGTVNSTIEKIDKKG